MWRGFRARLGPRLEGTRVRLRLPERGDYGQWSSLRRESRDFLEPWEPRWAADELDPPAWRERVRRARHDHAAGTGLTFLVFERGGEELLGGIAIGHIRHGVSQSAQIGYWMGERHAGRGYMREAIGLVADHAFGPMRLHRLEAACIPENERSARVLENAGFRREGLLRDYLKINGTWRDHLLYALLAQEHAARGKRG
jgi:ribosomal-protein-alanine N-acetyltransferase